MIRFHHITQYNGKSVSEQTKIIIMSYMIKTLYFLN